MKKIDVNARESLLGACHTLQTLGLLPDELVYSFMKHVESFADDHRLEPTRDGWCERAFDTISGRRTGDDRREIKRFGGSVRRLESDRRAQPNPDAYQEALQAYTAELEKWSQGFHKWGESILVRNSSPIPLLKLVQKLEGVGIESHVTTGIKNTKGLPRPQIEPSKIDNLKVDNSWSSSSRELRVTMGSIPSLEKVYSICLKDSMDRCTHGPLLNIEPLLEVKPLEGMVIRDSDFEVLYASQDGAWQQSLTA